MCLVDTQLYRCESGKCSISTGSLFQTQPFSASVDLKWDKHAAGWRCMSRRTRWSNWADFGYRAKEKNTEWTHKYILQWIDFQPAVIKPDQSATLNRVGALLLSPGSLSASNRRIEINEEISSLWQKQQRLYFYVESVFSSSQKHKWHHWRVFSRENMFYIFHQMPLQGLDCWTCPAAVFKGSSFFLT